MKKLFFLSILLAGQLLNPVSSVFAQTTPTILINGVAAVANNINAAPYWLSAGQTLAIGDKVNAISVLQYNVSPAAAGGNELQFESVLSVTTLQAVLPGKAWKIESAAIDPSATIGGSGDNWGSQAVLTNSTLTGIGTATSLLGLSQQGATIGQNLQWNGSAWMPASPTPSGVTNVATGAGLTGGPITSTGTVSLANGTGVGQIFVTGSSPFTPALVTMSGDAIIGSSGTVKVNALESATTSVNVSSATAPTAGQVLTATSSTAATWQTPSGGSTNLNFTMSLSSSTATLVNVANSTSLPITVTLNYLSGTNAGVAFSITGLPSGVTSNISPGGCFPACSANLVFTGNVATIGTYTVTLNASGGGYTQSATISLSVVAAVHGSQTFSYTGSSQIFQVPSSGVSFVTLDVYGAQGGNTLGGKGGEAIGTLSVTPGQILYVFVGSQNCSCSWSGEGGGGGGGYGGGAASSVRTGYGLLQDRIIVAGGGGGTGDINNSTFTAGGAGGGLIGGTGSTNSGQNGGAGGTQSSGGAGGTGTYANGKNGVLGAGGSCGWCNYEGGGGGGYYGGGGGGVTSVAPSPGGGGGGGSNYLSPSLTNTTNSQGVRSADGQVIITW